MFLFSQVKQIASCLYHKTLVSFAEFQRNSNLYSYSITFSAHLRQHGIVQYLLLWVLLFKVNHFHIPRPFTTKQRKPISDKSV